MMGNEPERRSLKLYSLPLSEFTAARNDLAKELRSLGDRESADEIRKLGKPSISAWAVNQLYFERRSTFDQLLAAGRDQRKALRSKLTALQSAGGRKRELHTELLKAAAEVLKREGTDLSPALRQRISRTLDTLAAWPPGGEPPPLGRLTADLEPAGFDTLLGAQIAAGKSAVRKDPPAAGTARKRDTATALRRRKEAAAEVAQARRNLAAAKKAETAAKRKLTRSEATAEGKLEKAKAAELAAERARQQADAAELSLRKARAARDRASQAAERQLASLETAERKLADLG